jgi:pimeloyl-ACP methyl ester carboxylesterase
VLLHGFGTTGDMWVPLATLLVANHTVIVPDLRGLGLSSKPSAGYDKKTQGLDIAGVDGFPGRATRRLRDPRYRQHGRLRFRRRTP